MPARNAGRLRPGHVLDDAIAPRLQQREAEVSFGIGMAYALQAAVELEKEGISAEVVEPQDGPFFHGAHRLCPRLDGRTNP